MQVTSPTVPLSKSVVTARCSKVQATFTPDQWASVRRSPITGEVVVRFKAPAMFGDIFVFASNMFGEIETFLVTEGA